MSEKGTRKKAEAAVKRPAHVQAKSFPKQGNWLNSSVRVKFIGDRRTEASGTVVREDMTFPGLTIIRLDDGRHVLGSEVRYQPAGVAARYVEEPSRAGHESLGPSPDLVGLPVRRRRRRAARGE